MEKVTSFNTFRSILEGQLNEMRHQLLAESARKGEEDGKRNLPAANDDIVSPFERELTARCQAQIEQVAQEGNQRLHDVLDTRVVPSREQLENLTEADIAAEIEQVTRQHDRQLEELQDNHLDRLKELHNAPDWVEAKRDRDRAEADLNAVSARVGRSNLHIPIRPAAALMLILAIGIAELPLNYSVFLRFREAPWMTLLLSLSLVITLPVLAHSSGRFLCQWKERKSFIAFFIFSFIAAGALNYVTAFHRGQFLADAKLPSVITEMTFFCIGMGLYFVGLIVSFQAHDPSVSLSSAHKVLRAAEKRLVKENARANKAEEEEKLNYQTKKEQIQRDYLREEQRILNTGKVLEQNLHQAVGFYNEVLRHYQGLERKVSISAHEAIQHYRGANLTFRTNHAQPRSWQQPLPALTLYLQNLPQIEFKKHNVNQDAEQNHQPVA